MKRFLLIIVGCMVGLVPQASAQRTDACSTPANTSLGSNWTMVQCVGRTLDTLQGTTTSVATPSNVTAGDLLVSGNGQCPPNGGGGCPPGSFPAAAIYNSDSLGSVATGKVNTSGTTVTLSSGLPFGMQGCHYSTGCLWNHRTIKINGVAYTISTVKSLTQLILTTSAGTQTAVSYSGPGWGCTDTAAGIGVSTSICWAIAASSAADTVTVTGPNNYSLSEAIAEFKNSAGIGSVDAAACPTLNCGGIFQSLGAATRSAEIVGNLSGSGELFWVQGNFDTGPVRAGSGFNGLIVGKTNQTQTEVKAVSSSGITSGTLTTSAADNTVLQMIAFSSGSTPATPVPSIGLTNTDCWYRTNSTYCGSGGSQLPFGFPLSKPSILVACAAYTGSTPAPSDTANNNWLDWGPGAVGFSGNTEFIKCYYALNKSTTIEETINWTNGPNWTMDAEYTGLATFSPRDGGAGVGYASNANATSGSGGAVTTGSVKTVTSGDLIIGFYSPLKGPPGAPGSGFISASQWDGSQELFGGGTMEHTIQTTAGTINPAATDGAGSGDAYAGETIAFKPRVLHNSQVESAAP